MKIWGYLSRESKGELLLSEYEGAYIQVFTSDGWRRKLFGSQFDPTLAYRVEPESSDESPQLELDLGETDEL